MNNQEEYRDGYLVTEKVKKIWACEVNLVKELFRVCDKYKLKCWADSGTLLGAVRHKGFIPWDDDIDLVMFRDDYDKLLEVADKEFCYPYLYQTAYTDRGYIRGHAQLRDSSTTAIRPDDKKQKFNQGIFIDIFPLDGVTSSRLALEKQEAEVGRMFHKLHRAFYAGFFPIKRFPFKLYLKFYPAQKYFKRIEALYSKYKVEDCELVSYLGFSFDKKFFKSKHIYDDTIYLDFEDIKMPVPANYRHILACDYGDDYMTPKQMPTMHGMVIFDTERPYNEVLKELNV